MEKIIYSFIAFYRSVMQDKLPTMSNTGITAPRHLRDYLSDCRPADAAVITFINSGDCGVAALAIGGVLAHLGHNVTYCENGHHAYIKVGNKYYDTLCPKGQTDETDMYGYLSSCKLKAMSLKSMHNAWVPYDNIGLAVINAFRRFHGAPPHPYESADPCEKVTCIPGQPLQIERLS